MNSFNKILINWYDDKKYSFPWRESSNPYYIWVSEIMLQQTQVNTVIPFYNAWIKKFPTLNDVAKASDEEIFKCWEGLGYYQRALNLRDACITIVNHYNSEIPQKKEQLLTLKGIGEYTASAILSIAFGFVHPAIDGNIKRIMSRLLLLPDFKTDSINKIESFLTKKINQNRPGDFNQALMDLGRTICRPRTPKCSDCPISIFCLSFKNQKTHLFPVKNKNKKIIPHYNIGVGIIWNNNKILITKRKKNQLLGGLWEFPGGKIKEDESILHCIKREVKEELGIKIKVNEFIIKINHQYSHFKITLHAYNCQYISGSIKCIAVDDWKWIRPTSFSDYPFPKANHYIFPKILNNYEGVC